jgi:hypothetical protein
MHFVFEATNQDGKWNACWSGSTLSTIEIIVTEATTKEKLKVFVKNAIEFHLEYVSKIDSSFTFEIIYL